MSPVDTVESPDCPRCPHPATEHGTYGCLSGWERARYTESIIRGCRCNQRGVRPLPEEVIDMGSPEGYEMLRGWM